MNIVKYTNNTNNNKKYNFSNILTRDGAYFIISRKEINNDDECILVNLVNGGVYNSTRLFVTRQKELNEYLNEYNFKRIDKGQITITIGEE